MTVTHLGHREGSPGHFGILHAIWPKSDLGHFCFRVTIYLATRPLVIFVLQMYMINFYA